MIPQTQSVSKTLSLFRHSLLPKHFHFSPKFGNTAFCQKFWPTQLNLAASPSMGPNVHVQSTLLGQTDGKTTTTTIMDNMQETSQRGVLFYSKKSDGQCFITKKKTMSRLLQMYISHQNLPLWLFLNDCHFSANLCEFSTCGHACLL